MKAQLEKERLELERQREEEEARRRKELAGVQESLSVDVPSPQSKPPSVTVEVPPDVLQVLYIHLVALVMSVAPWNVYDGSRAMCLCGKAPLEHIVCH